MNKSEYHQIHASDQFNQDMMSKKTPYNAHYYNFREGDAALFAPTFKIIPGTSTININHRIPGWTDRILYRSRNLGYRDDKGDILTLVNYDSNNLVTFSDHRPVFAQFILRMDKHIDAPAMRKYYGTLGYAGPEDGAAEEAKEEMYGPDEDAEEAIRSVHDEDEVEGDGADIIGMAEQAYALGKSYDEH